MKRNEEASLRRWKDKEGRDSEVETGKGERERWSRNEKSGQERETERKKWLCLLCGESEREEELMVHIRRASSCQSLCICMCVCVCVCLYTCKGKAYR